MLGGDDHQGIGPCGREFVAHAAIAAEEVAGNVAIGQLRAARDAGGVAADAGKHEAHRPATFSSKRVVIA